MFLTGKEIISRGIVDSDCVYNIKTHGVTLRVDKVDKHLVYLKGVVRFPDNVAGILTPCLGVCGSTGFIDPGFNGQLVGALFVIPEEKHERSECGFTSDSEEWLEVPDPYQLVCFSVANPVDTYTGQYQNKVYEQLSLLLGGVV